MIPYYLVAGVVFGEVSSKRCLAKWLAVTLMLSACATRHDHVFHNPEVSCADLLDRYAEGEVPSTVRYCQPRLSTAGATSRCGSVFDASERSRAMTPSATARAFTERAP